MNGLRLAAEEFRAVVRDRKRLIPVLGVCTIPLLYSFGFLWSFWDPYGRLDKLPVAVVNEDRGTTVDGKVVHVGADLVDRLRRSDTFAWSVVTPAEAEQGLADHRYYMVITIPPEFSRDSMTALDAHPVQAKLDYTVNDEANYLATQMSRTAMEKIKEQVGDTVTEVYTQTLLADLRQLGAGLGQAEAGADRLKGGATRLGSGAQSLADHLVLLEQGADSLAGGVAKAEQGAGGLAAGAQRLETGADALSQGLARLQDGSAKVAQGAHQLAGAGEQLESGLQHADGGAHQVANGATQVANGAASLHQGLDQLTAAQAQLAQGSAQALAGAKQLDDGLHQAASASDALVNGAAALSQQVGALQSAFAADPALQSVLAEHPALAQQLQQLAAVSQATASQMQQAAAAQRQLVQGADALVDGLGSLAGGIDALGQGLQRSDAASGQLADGAQQVSSGALSLASGLDTLVGGAASLTTGAQHLSGGVDQVHAGVVSAAQGGAAVAAGSNRVASGAAQLANGLTDAASGARQVTSGAGQLAQGAATLTNGIRSLEDGAGQLATKLAPAAERLQQLHTGDVNAKDVATPVTAAQRTLAGIRNYGTGLAPYFTSLALYVGALMLTVVWPMRDPAARPRSGLAWFLGKAAFLASVGVAQAGLVDLALLAGLRVQVAHPWAFVLFSIGVSWTFLLLLQLLVSALQEVGRYLGIVILIAQLCASGGTFPLPLLPALLQHLSPYLPMTYTVNGFRAIIAGDEHMLVQSLAHLWVFPVAIAMCTVAWFTRLQRRGVKQNDMSQPSAGVSASGP